MVELTRDEAIGLAEFMELTLLDEIRGNYYIDSLEWLCNMMAVYRKCKECEENGGDEK